MSQQHINDSVHWYTSELTSRVVAKSGITTDRFHIGKIMMQSFNDDPNFIAQIDGGTGVSESNGSLLRRSIQCAISFRELGLKQGDVMILMAPNHLDLAVPFCAAMYLGVIAAPVDRTFTLNEMKNIFPKYDPKIILCQSEKASEIQTALDILNLRAKIITFDGIKDEPCFDDLLQVDDNLVKEFTPEDFNAENSIAVILPTSGTTGVPKGAAITHKTWMITVPNVWSRYDEFPTPSRMWLILSPIQWLTTVINFVMSPFIKYTRLQTSKPVTIEHTRHLIETYKPTMSALSSTIMAQLLKPGEHGPTDLSCFESILVGGSAVHKELMQEIQIASPKTKVINMYGMTELAGLGLSHVANGPIGSSGKPSGIYQYRLIDINTKEDILEPNVTGELWVKGPGMFKEYYNNPEGTKEAFAEDMWLKTGDLFYRDEHWHHYFVGRIKLLLKYKNFQIAPAEIEGVIRKLPAVLDVAVVGIPDPVCGDLPAACIIRRPGHSLTAEEIKNLVKDNLSESKQLRGGVVFMEAFPLTSTTKISYATLRNMLQQSESK